MKRTDVKLKIFDINGREIIELVNQEQSAGTYEAEFNGIEISSGIYFAVLNAGNFKDVIRMILVK
ncbi:MAG: T9SS type A sorting domain-containing protein [Ignavibacteria bacterium]|nr:T9SS type A sorting domain-containing protein [Ignavibacteria bacterium]